MFQLTADAIHREDLIRSIQERKAGALVVFEGWVRDHNQGQSVSSLEYQVYEALALREGEKIIQEAREKFNVHELICVHRHGHLVIGDTAVWIGASASHRDEAFKATRYVIDEIKLRLPIWKKEHYTNQKAEWVFCKDHHTHVHFNEADYYFKQAAIASPEKLKNKRVLVVGAGGLGCPVLVGLATAGVGTIQIVDFDQISISNIHRQPLYTPDVVGEKKVVVAKNKIAALNPFIQVIGVDARLSVRNVEKLIQDQDLILDCTDNLETKFLLHDACFKYGIPLVAASIYRFEGQLRTFDPHQKNGCLRCTVSETPDDAKVGNCNDFGALGVSVATLGAMQASEAIQFLLKNKNSTQDSTFYFNLENLSQMKIKNIKKPLCQTCEGNIELVFDDLEKTSEQLLKEACELIDIRDKDDSFIDSFTPNSKNTVLYCHRGIRSKRLVKTLRARGITNVFSLEGGACSL